jgi:hypothetical protein
LECIYIAVKNMLRHKRALTGILSNASESENFTHTSN